MEGPICESAAKRSGPAASGVGLTPDVQLSFEIYDNDVRILEAATRIALREALRAIIKASKHQGEVSNFLLLLAIEGRRILIAVVYVKAKPPHAHIARTRLELEALVGGLSGGALRGEAQIRAKDPLGIADEQNARINVYDRHIEKEWWKRGHGLF